ncbi:hypothetical protein MMC14_009210 [Varicellaria rhodocarpa]|nr:hypothetical protein [Varicellaria rhodocarpa]
MHTFHYLILAAAALLLHILFKLISNSIARRSRDAEAARRGCGPAPTLPKMDPLGLTRLIDALKAAREERSPQYIVEVMDDMGKDVHTVRALILDYEVLVTRDPENVQAMFATQAQDFGIAAHRAGNWEPLLGAGIFTSQGEAWKHSRALVRPQFTGEQVSHLDLEERHVQALSKTLNPQEDGWTGKVDLQPLFLNFTLDTATEFLYGQSTHSQGPAHSTPPVVRGVANVKPADFGRHLDAGKEWICTKGAFGKWHSLIYSRDFSHHCSEVHRYVDSFVQRRLKRGPKMDNTSNKFVLLDELAKHSQNPLELRNETLQLLNAGRDTTGALIGWVFYFLARHPRVYAKLRQIILAEFGSYTTSDISFVKLRSCDYVHHCINESLRVAGVVPINERVCTQDTTLPRGGGADGSKPIFITKGQRVLITTYAMQHRADIWGEDVEEFKPERWEGRKYGWEFIPFGGGPRKCIGQQFSVTEISYLMVRLLQRFDRLENVEPPGPIRHHHTVSNRSGTGVQVRLHEAAA